VKHSEARLIENEEGLAVRIALSKDLIADLMGGGWVGSQLLFPSMYLHLSRDI